VLSIESTGLLGFAMRGGREKSNMKQLRLQGLPSLGHLRPMGKI
jgi:hypothetical protein